MEKEYCLLSNLNLCIRKNMVNIDKGLMPQFFRGLPSLDLNKTPRNFSENMMIISGYEVGVIVNSPPLKEGTPP